MVTKRNGWRAVIMLSAVLLFSSCATTPVPLLKSTVPIEEKKAFENLGPSSGSDTAWAFLGLWMRGKPDVDDAFKEAMAKKKGEAMINVTCRERTVWFVLFSLTTVSVRGEVIKFNQTEKKNAGKK